jgi:hypothetical protein
MKSSGFIDDVSFQKSTSREIRVRAAEDYLTRSPIHNHNMSIRCRDTVRLHID